MNEQEPSWPLRPRSDVDDLTYLVYCHVCPGRHPAEKAGLPGDTDRHPRYVSRSIGSTSYGALWHCPEHNDPEVDRTKFGHYQNIPRAACGCPVGNWTDELPTPEQLRRWEDQQESRSRANHPTGATK